MQTLHRDDCLPCEKIHGLLDSTAIQLFLARLGAQWELSPDLKFLTKKFYFENHYQTLAFVNGIAWMTHFKTHPPELEINRDFCLVRYTSSSIEGLSEFDFLCANKVEHLFKHSPENAV